MTKKEIAKLAQVIDAKYCHWMYRVKPEGHRLTVVEEQRQIEITELITQFDRPFKNQQHKRLSGIKVNGKRVPASRRTGRTVTVINQSGRKTLQSVKPVKMPEE